MPSPLIQYRHGNYSIHGNFLARFKVEVDRLVYLVDVASSTKEGIEAIKRYLEYDFDYGNNLGDIGHEFVAVYTVSNSKRVYGVSSTDFSFTSSNDYDTDSCFDVRPLNESLIEVGHCESIRFSNRVNTIPYLEYVDSIFDFMN